MGKVNVWLKRSYVCTIGVIAIIAVLTLGIAIFGHGRSLHEEDDQVWMGIYTIYGFSVVTLLFAIIGGFGIWKEKKWALIAFAVGMILGCLFFILIEISIPFTQKQTELLLKNYYLSMLPLSNVSESKLSEFEHTQSVIDTYGPTHNDSGPNVLNVNPIRIYAQPCIPVLIQFEEDSLSIFFGVMLAKILLWILSVGLCIAILFQLNKKVEIPNVVYSREAKAGNYDILNDAQEPSFKIE